MKKIKFNVGKIDEVNKAKQEIDLYTREFVAKVNFFVRRLGEIGVATVEQRSAGQNFSVAFHIKNLGLNSLEGTLLVSGEELLFFEFGTGVHYNQEPSPHPDGVRLGMIIGEYGRKQGKNDYWYYQGKKVYGNPAKMPVYMAYVEIISNFERVVKEVFTV